MSLFIDGYEQELVSFTSNLATFKVTNLDYTSTDNVQVYTSEGFPWGSDVIHTLDFTPSLLKITPSTGSSAGSWITVEGTGFGIQSTGLNLQADGSDLCAEVDITGYGVFRCLTNAVMVAESVTLDLSINSVAQASFVDAIYSQTEMITVTAANVIGNAIEFIGINFPTTDYVAYASFGGIEVLATVNDAQTAMANWDATGIAAALDGVPSLYFVHVSN